MAKLKFGKKDIFAPAPTIEKKEESQKAVQPSLKKSKAKVSKKHPSDEAPRMIIHSFRIREDLVEKLKEYAFFNKTKIYKVINQAVENFLKNYKPEDHMQQFLKESK